MVTITQTKSEDLTPLFSSHVVDDISTSSSAAPTYVKNEATNLIVTESCLLQIEHLLKQRRAKTDQPEDFDDGYFLRVFVDAGGCSGFQYQFEVDNELDEDEDVVVVMAELPSGETTAESSSTVMLPRVVVDEASMGFLEGSTIDYVIEMIKSAFVVSDNPQSESACGCGSSFALKNFEKYGAKK
jgi:iron-sulfur cluster assembly accessory protein